MIAGVQEAKRGEKKKHTSSQKTGQCKVKSEHAVSYGVRRGAERDQYIQKYRRAIEETPDQDMQVSGGQFQGKLQSAIQESLIL